jgi:hypothetical protein
LALIPIGATPSASRPAAPPLDALNLAVQPVSDREIDQPAVRAMHAASALPTPDRVAAWRSATPRLQARLSGSLIPLQPFVAEALPVEPIEKVIMRRGSTRQFTRAPITFAQLSTVLYQSLRAWRTQQSGNDAGEVYLNPRRRGLARAYVLHRTAWALELLKPGDFR